MFKTFLKIVKFVDTKTPWSEAVIQNTPTQQAQNLTNINHQPQNCSNANQTQNYTNTNQAQGYTKYIWRQANILAKKLCRQKDKNRHLIRICGQTGSGKTSQVLWAVQECNKIKNKRPVVLAIRDFAKFHPNYNRLYKEFGSSQIREKTNGFALKLLSATLLLLIEKGCNIVLDMTLLAPEYEKILQRTLAANNYRQTLHLLAVNKKLSKHFLNKRQAKTGRVVYDSSRKYFNKSLNKSLKFLSKTDTKSNCFVWTAFDKSYVYYGKIYKCLQTFLFHQARLEVLTFSPDDLQKSKLNSLLLLP